MTASELAGRFEHIYGSVPRIFRAPGRVNLIGEHTDYNDGYVMPAAIGFFTQVAIAPRSDRKLVVRSEEFERDFEFDLDHLPQSRVGAWCDYVLGVASVLQQEGHALRGANLLVRGEVPIGAGLSSSAAVEVASALALLSLNGAAMALPEVAKLCQRSENNFVGARVGIMDQFVSCMGKAGHAFFLDCRSLEFKLVPMPPDIRLVVCNTMVKHALASGSYNQRREECEEGVKILARWDPAIRALRDVSLELLERHAKDLSEDVYKRCLHVVREDQRVLDAAECLRKGDLKRLGELMRDSHRSLRDLYEVSCRELDVMVEAAEGLPGYCGGRMTGGGFGGCTVSLVHSANAEDFAQEIAKRYEAATGIKPNVYVCSAEDGAQALN
ncbi:MAG: galactokinase [Acidobacteriia bacterium]|nr:galactokinase [Terriglobia bacterium]